MTDEPPSLPRRTQLGESLRAHRLKAGLTLGYAARQANLSEKELTDLENGLTVAFDTSIIEMLSRAYLMSGQDTAELLNLNHEAFREMLRYDESSNSEERESGPVQPGARAPVLDNIMAEIAQRSLDNWAKSTISTNDSNAPLAFLCHSSGDKEQVRRLYHRLLSDGVRCWFDEEDLLPGQKWRYEIERAIRRSRFVLACLSGASLTKTGYVQKELKTALDVADEQPEARLS